MPEYDLILRNGLLYDGSGAPPVKGDLAISGDSIAALGELPADARASTELDVKGMAVAPGFINMLSWSVESLIEDGCSQSEIRQGVTLEVMGEGSSMGPLSDEMKINGPGTYMAQGDIKYEVEWTTLGEYLEWLEARGVSCNIASFVGSSTLRIYVMGYEDRPPEWEELDVMRDLLREAMEEGAMGMSAALIYTPAVFSNTEELIDLAEVVAEYDGMYISHMRSESHTFLEALDEFLGIAGEANVTAEVYHLKAAGRANWHKLDEAIQRIEDARAQGLNVTADMYTYTYSGTGLDACIPPWAHEGGHASLIARLRDPQTRARIKAEMSTPSDQWDNMFLEYIDRPDNILLSGFKKDEMKPLQGKRLSEVMAERGTSAEDTLFDLILEDDSRIFTIYFNMLEDNLRKQVALPWVSFCSDAESQAPEGVFLRTNPHPRAYGAFARLLAKYVRDEGIIPLEEAIRRLTSFPAANLKIEKRGTLREGYYADVVVFDPAAVQDHATPENPHQYATGMAHVFVNGVQVLKDGEHTGAKPGRVVRGPGYKKPPFHHRYPAVLHPLLTLGEDYDGTYAEFKIGRDYIPNLIRMATDIHLLHSGQDAPLHAPYHAMRRLAQLKAKEAIEPLMTVLQTGHPLTVIRELPPVLAELGTAVIAPLQAYMSNTEHPDYARSLAAFTLLHVGQEQSPEIYSLCETLVIRELEKYAENSPALNAFLINYLVNAEADMEELVAQVFAAGRVDEDIAGSWKEVQVRLGVRLSDNLQQLLEVEPYSWEEAENPADAQRKANAQKKAKRKQTAKSKKLNRRKKR